jgi:hypothetical protein
LLLNFAGSLHPFLALFQVVSQVVESSDMAALNAVRASIEIEARYSALPFQI